MKIEDVLKVKHDLKKVKPKPKTINPDRKLNLKEIIFELAAELEKLKISGYSYAEIAEILKQKDITVSSQTLSKYLSDFRKKATVRPVEEKPVRVFPQEQKPQTFIHDRCPDMDRLIYGDRNK